MRKISKSERNFSHLNATSRRASRKRRLGVAAAVALAPLAGLLATTARAASNTTVTYINTAGGALDLNTNWTGNTEPGSTNDALINATTTSGFANFTLNTSPETFGSLDDTNTNASTITASQALTLGGNAGNINSVSGVANDLLYIASGSTLTNYNGAGITLAQAGNFDIAGTATIGASAPITDGGLGITKTGVGLLTDAAANSSLTGNVSVNGGTLSLTGSIGGGTAAGALNVGGGTFSYGGSGAQSFTGLAVNVGQSAVVNTATGATPVLMLNGITRTLGGTVDFTTATATTNEVTTTTINDAGGILGGWATQGGGATWAVGSPDGVTPTPITGLTTYTTASATASTDNSANIDVNFSSATNTSIGNTTPNSIRFSGAAANTLTFTGTTSVTSGGVLIAPGVGAHASLITGGTIEGSSGGDLIVNQWDTNAAGTLTISSVIANNTSKTGLTLSGPGTVDITNAANSYTGGATIASGTTIVTASQASGTSNGPLGYGTGSITLAGGRLSSNGSSQTLYNPINVTGSASQLTTGGNNLLLYGAFSGSGAFTVGSSFVSTTAASVVIYDNLGSFTGTVNFLGNATDNLIFGANGLNTTAKFNLSGSTSQQQIFLQNATYTIGQLSGTGGAIKDQTPTGTLVINQSTNTTFAGLLGDSSHATFNVTKANTGFLSLTDAASVYTGVTTITGGILSTGAAGILANGGSASSIGSSSNAAGSLVLDGGTLQYANTGTAETTNRLFTVGSNEASGGAGTLDASGTSTITFNNTGAVAYGTTGQTRTLNLTGTNTGANTLTPVIGNNGSGAVSVAKTGVGAWTLASSNSYSGGTTVSQGSLTSAVAGGFGAGNVTVNPTGSTGTSADAANLYTTGAIASTAAVTVNSNSATEIGTIYFNDATPTIGSLTGTGNVVLNKASGTNLTTGSAGPTTFSGVISNANGVGSLTKTGSSTFTLSGSNTYGGATTINQGTLALGTGGSIGNGSITINNNGALSGANTTFVGNTATNASGGSITVNSGGILSVAGNGSGATFTIKQETSDNGNLLTLAGGIVNVAISSSSSAVLTPSDTLVVGSNTNGTGNGLVSVTSPSLIAVNTTNVTGLAVGAYYDIINAGSGLGGTNLSISDPNLTVGGSQFHFSLSDPSSPSTSNEEVVTVETGATAAPVAYWWGGINSSWAAQNSGTAQTNPFYANFTSDPAGTSNTLTLPSSTTNVFFTTSNAMNQNATTLDQAFTINSLNFTSGNTGSTISAGSETNAQTYNTLTINAAAINGNAGNNGITVNTGSGPNTINANVILGASQTWTNASSNVLTVAGSVTNNGNTLSTAGAGPIAISGNIGGNGGFTAGGSGTVTLSGTNGYTGVTTAAGGTLQFTSEASLYNDATAASWSASNIIVQSGATLALSVGGTGQFSTTDVATLLANLDGTVASDGLMGGSAIGFDTTSAAGGNFTISGNITDTTGTGGGSVGVTKLGTNTLTLQGTNTYTGVLTLDGGILNAATSNIDGTSTTNGIVFNGGTLQAASGGITTAKAVTLNAGGGTFDTGAAATSTLSGAIGGAGGLTVIGSGLLTLQGANNYTGVLTLNGGVLNAATTNINGSSTTNGIVFNGGTLQAASGGITTGKAVTLNAGGGTFDTGTAATSALSGVIGGAGGLTVVGTGTVTLGNASSSYSGGTSISSGTVIVSASQASGTSNGPVGYGTGAITLAGGRLSSNASGETLYNPINVTGTTGQLTTGGTSNNPYGNLLLYGAVTGNGEFTVGNSFVNTYAASVELFDSLSGFTGTVNYIGNATDNLIFSNAVNTTANFTLSGSTSSQYLQFPNATNTIGALSGTGGLIKGPGTLQINQSASTAFAGILGGSTALNVTKAGSGMLSLTNANTYTGVTTITGGILSTGSTGILANGGTASYIGQSTNAAANLVLNGGTLQYANTTNTAESTDRLLTLLGNGSLDASGSSTITFAGNGTGAANAISVTASSSPTLTFTGTNTGANTFKPIIGNKNGTIITSVAKTGAGAWVLSGTNTYTGGTSINNGTLAVSNASALGTTGNLSFGGGTLQYIGINTDFSSRFSTAASQAYSVDTNGQAVAFETPLTSSGGSLAVSDTAGTGNLTLTGASTYNGATTINAGATLYLGNGTTDGSIASTSGVNLSGTLVYNLASSPRTVAYSIGGTGTGGNVTLNGPQALTLTAANTYSGTTSVAGGTLYVSNTSGSGTGTSAVNVTGGTLSGTGSIAGNIALSSASTTGTLEPGTQSAATGKLTASAGSVGGTGNYVADIAFGTAAGNGSPPDTASELMATGGAVDVSHMNFSVNLLGAAAGTTGAITPNETFVIVDSTTPITVNGSTVFGSLASPQGGLTYTVAYNATGGFPGAVNDSGTSDAEIAVTIDSVPEPTSLGFIGLAGVGLMRRRRRRTIA